MKRAAGLHPAAQTERAMRAFVADRGLRAALHRATEIERLPRVTWKGATLYTIRCRGSLGRGPHEQHVPEGLLWALIYLDRWMCPYHAGGYFDGDVPP